MTMKLKQLIITACAFVPMALAAQPVIHGIEVPAFLERGVQMYGNQNYIGAIDQLNHLTENLPADDNDLERAEFYKALSAFELDDTGNLETLRDFLDEYPFSRYAPLIQMRIGDYYFYRGDYKDALVNYSQLSPKSLDLDADEDLRYRMAYSHLQLGRWSDARELYDALENTRRYRDASNFYQAYIDYAQGDYDSALERFSQVDRTGALGYQAQYYLAQIYYAKNNYSRVLELGNTLIEDNANDYFMPEIHRLVGESYYHTGDIPSAKRHLTNYLTTTEDPVVRSSAYILGLINYDSHDLKGAAQAMSQVTGEDDALAQSANLYLGQCHLANGDLDKAAMAFEKAARMRHDPKVRETAFYNYAITQSQGGRTPFNNSIDMFEQFLNDYPTSTYKSNVENYLYDAYLTTSDYERALESISHIKNPGQKVLAAKQNVLYNLGVQELSNDRPKGAREYFNQAIALGKLDAKAYNESHLWLGEALYRTGDYAGAEKSLKKFIEATSTSNDNYGIAQYNLGYALFQQRKYSDAVKAFQAAIKSDRLEKDITTDAYNRLGDTRYYTQDLAGADKAYTQAMSMGNNSEADYSLFQRARMAGLQKDYAQQATLLASLVQQYPQSALVPAAMLERGNALANQGNNSEAVAALDQLIAKYPSSAEARYAMLQQANIYQNSGNADKAEKAYRNLITKYPTSEEAADALDDLKLIAAEKGELAELSNFLKGIKGAPQLDISEAERLTFEAAERILIEDNGKTDKMESYLSQYPRGAYVGKAHYYLGRKYYDTGKLDAALKEIDTALDMGDDAGYAEDALAIKSAILVKKGRGAEAIEVYRTLAAKASTDDNKIIAQMGLMRAAKQSKQWKEALKAANTLLNQGGLNSEEEKEVKLARAMANSQLGNVAQAQTDLEALANDTRNEYGAQAAYELALLKYNAGNLAGAETALNKFIDSGTPHSYWLAKGYILLADVYYKQGNKQDAIEYLTSLKQNYPGREGEIFNEIDSRLSKWTTTTKKKRN